jgi:propionyl-CoA synthetase
VVAIEGPLPPGCMQTVWRDDALRQDLLEELPGTQVYSTFDWGIRDEDGYLLHPGPHRRRHQRRRPPPGHARDRGGISSHPNVAEVAVVGVADQLKGQVAMAFAVVKDASRVATPEAMAAMEKEVMATVDRELGAIARPARVCFVTLLPKTRSGKLLRRSIQALAEGRQAGDLTTLDDPSALEQIQAAVAAWKAGK